MSLATLLLAVSNNLSWPAFDINAKGWQREARSIRNTALTSDGHLDKATIKLASELKLHQTGTTNITDFPDKKSYDLHSSNLNKDRLAI